jgi:two-component system chemotaxis response regulator CheY
MRALVVEDDYTSRLLLHTFLARYGECDAVERGTDAWEAVFVAQAGGRAYDLICLDIMMPGIDGQEVLRGIRDQEAVAGINSNAGVKIIMTTALSDIKTLFASFHGLCDAYLVKPVDTGKLLAHLEAFGLVP